MSEQPTTEMLRELTQEELDGMIAELNEKIKHSSTEISKIIRDVPNFPKEGILFKDITPILGDSKYTTLILSAMYHQMQIHKLKNPEYRIDAIAGIESRGFLFGNILAYQLGKPFIMVRKAGKLPAEKKSKSYDLEYGQATIEIHTDAIKPGMNVLIHDDLLATGGTAAAAAELIQDLGGNIAGFSFIIDLTFLNGKDKLTKFSPIVDSLIQY